MLGRPAALGGPLMAGCVEKGLNGDFATLTTQLRNE